MAQFTLIMNVLSLIAQLYPKISPMVKDIFNSFKKDPPPDITQEEFEVRIDAAIAGLPPWE